MKVLVTGASEGMGGAICRAFAAAAHASGEALKITLSTSGRHGQPDALLNDLAELGAEAKFVAANLADPDDCVRLAETAMEFSDGIDSFISNAGAMRSGRLSELAREDWDALFNINVRPTFLISQKLYPALKASRGSITAISSVVEHVPSPGTGAYPPSKAALSMLIKQIAQEWAPDGIRANAIAPGMVRTPLTEKAYLNPEVHATRLGLVPLGKIGSVYDIAQAVMFLSSGSQAGYITGQILSIDGGFVDSIYRHLPPLK